MKRSPADEGDPSNARPGREPRPSRLSLRARALGRRLARSAAAPRRTSCGSTRRPGSRTGSRSSRPSSRSCSSTAARRAHAVRGGHRVGDASTAGAKRSRSRARSGARSRSPRQNAHFLVKVDRRGHAHEVRRQGAVGQGAGKRAQRRHGVARRGRRVERDGRPLRATRAPSRTSSSRRCSRTI